MTRAHDEENGRTDRLDDGVEPVPTVPADDAAPAVVTPWLDPDASTYGRHADTGPIPVAVVADSVPAGPRPLIRARPVARPSAARRAVPVAAAALGAGAAAVGGLVMLAGAATTDEDTTAPPVAAARGDDVGAPDHRRPGRRGPGRRSDHDRLDHRPGDHRTQLSGGPARCRRRRRHPRPGHGERPRTPRGR